MQSTNTPPGWKQWLRPSRLVPLLTILAAGVAIVLSFLKLIQLSVAEEIVIALLALLAVDALNERLSLLERMRAKLGDLSAQISQLPFADIKLEKRDTLTGTLEGTLKGARRLDILGLNLWGILSHSFGSFERMVANPDNELRFLMVKPGSAAMDSAAGFTSDREQRAQLIWAAVKRLERLLEKGNVHLGFTSMAPPFSLLIIDPGKPGGITQVELYGCGTTSDERPHFTLTRDKQPWYDFFTQQFNRFWQKAQTLEEIEQELKQGGAA